MNKKKLIALQAVVVTVATVSAEASETRWHVGIDVGVSQYKQERKQRNTLTYKEVQELLEKQRAELQKARDFASNVNNMVGKYHFTKIQQKLANLTTTINNYAGSAAQQIAQVNQLVTQELNAVNAQNVGQIIANNIPAIAANDNADLVKQQAVQYFHRTFPKYLWGVSGDNYVLNDMEDRIGSFNTALVGAQNISNQITNQMNAKHHQVDDLLDEDLRKTYNLKSMYKLKVILDHNMSSLLSMNQLGWALTDPTINGWANTNWYGQPAAAGGGNNPTKPQLLNTLNELKKVQEAYGELLDEVKAKHCEKTSSPRITSPAVEANFGVTRQFGKGVLGAEVLVGVNCKEFGKKKKTDIYEQKKTPVYGAGIVRAGFMLGDRAEVYALGGVRFNGLSPIVGGGARFYSPTKSYFFKAEFQKTLGKKYPKGHTIKLGMGWTI